jgi:hypothetical protein
VDDLKELGSRLAVTLAIAIINREYITAKKLNEKARAQAYARGAIDLNYIAAQPIPGAVAQNVTPHSFIETVVDAAESWLFDAYREHPHVEHAPPNLAPIAVRATRRYCLQGQLNNLWNQALWEGWYLSSENNTPLWVPGDRQLATLIEAWRVRQESNFMNFVWVDMSVWAKTPPK